MSTKLKTAIFEGNQIRRHWNEEEEKWYFSVVDVIQVLTSQIDFRKARKYWNKLAERLRKEGSEVVTKCHQLKMLAADGKMRFTDVADTEISEKRKPKTFPENRKVAKDGGSIAGNARKQIEKKSGKKVITKKNATITS